uniref:Protein krueppel n=1 Tax=Anopheles christyi TaxID=43041 RepID=A0A182JV99_9DIPT
MASSEMEDLMFGEICRCCMASKPRMKPLFDTNLFAMLNAVTGMNVHQNDGLPSQLCVPCVLQIRRSHFFKVQCENTDRTLRSYAVETRQRASGTYTLAADGTYVKKEADSSSQNDDAIKPSSSEMDSGLMKRPLSASFYCQQCPKEFETEKKLKRHIRTHFIVKPHACTECSASFLERSNLKKHMLKHTGELRNSNTKTHLCSECGKSFKYSTSLSRHKRFHAQRNMFTCTVCSKAYVEQTSLDVHMRTHTNERPFMCTTCDKSFSQKANLERHERTHTEYLFFDEGNNGEAADRTAKRTYWKRPKMAQTDSDEEYAGEEEEEEDEGEEEEEEDEDEDEDGDEGEGEEGEEENDEHGGEENISILEEYEEAEVESQTNEEESVVHVVYNGDTIVEQEAYGDFVGDYDNIDVKEEPLLEIRIMNPNDVDSDIEQ